MKSARQVFEQFQECDLVLKENGSWRRRDETWSVSTGVRCSVDVGVVQDPAVLSHLGTRSVPYGCCLDGFHLLLDPQTTLKIVSR